jgi:hypothetical protein
VVSVTDLYGRILGFLDRIWVRAQWIIYFGFQRIVACLLKAGTV